MCENLDRAVEVAMAALASDETCVRVDAVNASHVAAFIEVIYNKLQELEAQTHQQLIDQVNKDLSAD